MPTDSQQVATDFAIFADFSQFIAVLPQTEFMQLPT